MHPPYNWEDEPEITRWETIRGIGDFFLLCIFVCAAVNLLNWFGSSVLGLS